LLFSFLPIVFIVVIFFILLILSNHSFHYFHTSFKWSRISTTFRCSWWMMSLSMFFTMLFLFFILLLLFFKLFNIAVPDIPLCNLSSKIVSDWRTSCSSTFFNLVVNSLNLTAFIVKFVSHSLFNSLDVLSTTRLLLLGLTSELLEIFFTIFFNLFLNLILIMTRVNIIAF